MQGICKKKCGKMGIAVPPPRGNILHAIHISVWYTCSIVGTTDTPRPPTFVYELFTGSGWLGIVAISAHAQTRCKHQSGDTGWESRNRDHWSDHGNEAWWLAKRKVPVPKCSAGWACARTHIHKSTHTPQCNRLSQTSSRKATLARSPPVRMHMCLRVRSQTLRLEKQF
jgi:hypothetical protein